MASRCTPPGPGDPSAEPRAVSRRTDLRTARSRVRRAAAAAPAHTHTHVHARMHARTRRTRTHTHTHTHRQPRRLPASPPPPLLKPPPLPLHTLIRFSTAAWYWASMSGASEGQADRPPAPRTLSKARTCEYREHLRDGEHPRAKAPARRGLMRALVHTERTERDSKEVQRWREGGLNRPRLKVFSSWGGCRKYYRAL